MLKIFRLASQRVEAPFEIQGRIISRHVKPFVIAEISGNHLGSLERCISLVDEAAAAGADAVKIQTLNPATITLDEEDDRFIVHNGPWAGRRVADIYRENMLPPEWHEQIFRHANDRGIIAFSSPFDIDAVRFLDSLNVPAFKIASNEILDWQLLQAVAETRKPLIVSTGTATEEQLYQTAEFLRRNGAGPTAFLYCVSAYPPVYNEIRLKTIVDMRKRLKVEIGLSDHTIEPEAAIAGVALGASIVEKHITLSREDGGSDAHFSLEPHEFKNLVNALNRTWEAVSGEATYPGSRDLSKDGIFTRQLWSKKKIKKGDLLTWDNIRSLRAPADTEAATSNEFEEIIGKRSNSDIDKNQPILKRFTVY